MCVFLFSFFIITQMNFIILIYVKIFTFGKQASIKVLRLVPITPILCPDSIFNILPCLLLVFSLHAYMVFESRLHVRRLLFR